MEFFYFVSYTAKNIWPNEGTTGFFNRQVVCEKEITQREDVLEIEHRLAFDPRHSGKVTIIFYSLLRKEGKS